MASFCWTRLDYRLVHGQVCVAWIPQLSVKRVIIISDTLGKNLFMAKLHQMAVPSGVKCDTYTLEKAIEEWNKDQFGNDRVMVLFQDPAIAKRAWDAGYQYDMLQIGTMPSSSGKKLISNQCYVSEEDAATFTYLIDKGVRVFCQLTPPDAESEAAELLKKAGFNCIQKEEI